MSYSCRLRQLAIPHLVAAMDLKLYRFAVRHGLAVYFEKGAVNSDLESESCRWGTKCFESATKGKTRAVYRLLKLGYNVIFSDVDIVLFKNPIEELTSFGPGVMAIQSNEFNESKAANSVHCLNSGFFFVPAERTTIEAFKEIIWLSSKGNFTQQAWFNHVLCGSANGSRRVRGRNECYFKDLRVVLLDRNKYPNGEYKQLWNQTNVSKACETLGCTILHCNFIVGHRAKKLRMISNKFWYYDETFHTCQGGYEG